VLRAAIYIRVSTEEQAREGFSIDAQKSNLIKKAQESGYVIQDFYIDDGFSAKDMRRPALTKVIADVKQKKIDVVLFWRLDRFTRSSKDFHKIDEIFSQYGAGIKSATEPIDTTTAIGRFQLQLSVLLGQLERETTSERVHFVMEDRHLKGLRNGAVAPFGYDLVDGNLVINPMEAEIVKRIFTIYQQNKSCRYIAKLFNAEGVPKRNDVSKWAEFTVWYIIDNPVYCGKLRWNNRKQAGAKTGNPIVVEGKHEPIISEEEFLKVHKLREFRKKEGKKATSDFPFTGVIKCARCGYGMIGGSRPIKNGVSRYYRCLGRFNYGVCDMPVIKEESINEAFLHSLSPDMDELEKLVQINDEIAVASEDIDLREQLEAELENIQKRKKKWQVAYANDAITLEELKEHTNDDKQREEYIKSQLEVSPKTQRSHWSRDEIIQQLRHLHDLWYQIEDDSAKKNFMNDVFEFIAINTDVTAPKGGPGQRTKVYITGWDFKS
jgi:site-specific DNA recombinase